MKIWLLTAIALYAQAGLAASQARSVDRIAILVVYHSVKGHTAALAKGVEQGARRIANTDVQLKTPSQVTCKELLSADALVVGSPVYWANMAGEIKTFFDRWTTDCKVLPPDFPMRDKVGAAFTTGGEVASGKELTLLTILAAMLGNRMIVLSEGQALGATATTGDGDQPLTEKDLDEGRRLGERVARVTWALKHGRSRP
jgi:NAD(P)H dehydrogenase (quinone)